MEKPPLRLLMGRHMPGMVEQIYAQRVECICQGGSLSA
jgi:hypothetical protein